LTHRANALVLFDNCWSCPEVADAPLLNDDTTGGMAQNVLNTAGIEGLTSFDMVGNPGLLSPRRNAL
jgi:hypothetical protein